MGMPLAFLRDRADFSGIDGPRALSISAAIDKADIAFNAAFSWLMDARRCLSW
jgi:hypothetical protein